MKIFVFQDLDQVFDSYHAGGGVVVVAENRNHAERVVMIYNDARKKDRSRWSNLQPTDDDVVLDWTNVNSYPLAPGDYEPTIFIFPDAGCC